MALNPLKDLIIEVTQACNHACVHCYNYWYEHRHPVNAKDALTRKEILKLVQDIRLDFPIESIALSGGEPLLRKDITGIANDLLNMGLNITIITNGTLLTHDMLEKFPKHLTFEMTLFSIDAAVHDCIAQQPDAFKKVISNAIAVHCHGSGLVIAIVLSRQNLKDIDKTIELSLAIGADAILINRVNLTAHSMPLRSDLVPSAEELKAALNLVEETAGKYNIEIALAVPIPPCIIEPTNYKNIHFGWCPRGGNDCYYTIGYNGMVRPCNHSSIIMGDLRKKSFKEIIKSPKAKKLWTTFPIECEGCTNPLRNECYGGCPAASFESHGTYGHIDPFVHFAKSFECKYE